MAAGRRVYIVGFMGSGKSTAGKKLASSLGWQFFDLDREIERKASKSINDIFSLHGEEYFRALESDTLNCLETSNDSVISSGGGTPCHGSNMDFMLYTGLVVYLRMTPGQLMSRLVVASKQRPLINNLSQPELLQYITGKLREREPYYLRASLIAEGLNPDIKVLTDSITSMLKR